MLRRRIVEAIFLSVVASCAPSVREKRELRSFEVRVPAARAEEFATALHEYAAANNFLIRTVNRNSGAGADRPFELRRRDLWIEGMNPPKEIPAVVPAPSNGRPGVRIEIDSERFIVGFYRGDIEPTEAALTEASNDFVASVRTVPGVSVSPRVENR